MTDKKTLTEPGVSSPILHPQYALGVLVGCLFSGIGAVVISYLPIFSEYAIFLPLLLAAGWLIICLGLGLFRNLTTTP